jgi:hypothetical protein
MKIADIINNANKAERLGVAVDWKTNCINVFNLSGQLEQKMMQEHEQFKAMVRVALSDKATPEQRAEVLSLLDADKEVKEDAPHEKAPASEKPQRRRAIPLPVKPRKGRK